jgi:methionyl-tRNA synthetase
MATRPETKDTNFSWDLFIEKINSDLNDTFGNFIHRTLTFLNSKFESQIPKPLNLSSDDKKILQTIKEKVDNMALDFENSKLQSAANTLISLGRIGNQYLNENEPWKLIKTEKQKAANVFYIAAQIVKTIAIVSMPFMPNIADQICEILNFPIDKKPLKWDNALQPLSFGHSINKSLPLFKKIDANEDELENKLKIIRQSDN